MRRFFAILSLALWACCGPASATATPAQTLAAPDTADQGMAAPDATAQDTAVQGTAAPTAEPAAAPPKAAAQAPATPSEAPGKNPPETAPVNGQDGWVIMPAGARSTYMGIHGGTMPVSLLIYGDGSSLVTFVGRTGNDFLEILRRTDLPVPSLLNATSRYGRAPLPTANGSVLMAGSPASSIPVLNLPGGSLLDTALSSGLLQPFGLSDKPLAIEGQVTRPPHLTPVRQYRLLFRPQYLQPRRAPR